MNIKPDKIRRPLLIYDGACGFCQLWIKRWQRSIGAEVDFEPSQKVGDDFPEIAPQVFEKSVVLIDPSGKVYRGAEAVFKALAFGGRPRGYRCYQGWGGFAWISERGYSLIANNRTLFYWLTRLLWGKTLEPSTYRFSSWLLGRLLGLVGLIAVLSLWVQADGLFGSHGILPAADFIQQVKANGATFWDIPTVLWWESSDTAITVVFALSTAAAGMLLIGVYPAIAATVLWLLYLSLSVAGQRFLQFQWDILLLETLVIAVFFLPWKAWDSLHSHTDPPRLARWLFGLLLFKLMIESGLVKFTFFANDGSNTWRDWTALDYHYFTQPLPNPLSPFFHHLPATLQKASLFCTYVIELFLPLFIFGPRGLRRIAFIGLAGLQVLIALSGNYGFFNLLSLVLCVSLLDDQSLPRTLRARWGPSAKGIKVSSYGSQMLKLSGLLPLAILHGLLLIFFLQRDLHGNRNPNAIPQWGQVIVRPIDQWRLVNSYGLFRVMTTRRPELIISGSIDGVIWHEYPFRWKPGDLYHPPRQAAPHMPRLDWQLWFAALENERLGRGRFYHEQWFGRFLKKLFEGEPSVVALMGNSPFPDELPRYFRVQLYLYKFSTPHHRKETGAHWERTLLESYTVEGIL